MTEKQNKKVRPYGTKQSQWGKVNRFFTLGMVIFYGIVLVNTFVSYKSGIRSRQYFSAVAFLIVTCILVNCIIYFKNKQSIKLRYAASIGLYFVYFLIIFATESEALRYLAIVPIIGCIIYYDKKLMTLNVFVMAALNAAYLLFSGKIAEEDMPKNIATLFTILLMLGIIWYTNYLGYRFNHDTLHNLQDEKQLQKDIMNHVLQIADEASGGAKKAASIVEKLDVSTGVVSVAIHEISKSTQNTAQNIQEQTVMTQKIQESIGDTVLRSEHMVEVADKSSIAIKESKQVIGKLNTQSETIAKANSNVVETMERLKEKVLDVKSIADTISDISTQTNLLSLNASIESARAGEAGRGFAVVAEQIRKLSEETRNETDHISRILEELSHNAIQTTKAVEESAKATKEQNILISSATESFEHIDENVNDLSENIEAIDKMLIDLSDSNRRIVDSITQLSASTQEVTANSQQASEISEKNHKNADEAKILLERVIEVSQQLDKYLVLDEA